MSMQPSTPLISTSIFSILIFLSAQIAALTPVQAQSPPPVTAEKLNTLLAISCPNFQAMAQHYQQKFITKMARWSTAHLSQAQYQTAFYPFSGPDIVSVMSLYPNANYYVLVADQVPEYAYMDDPEKLNDESLAFECQMLQNFSRRGYYLTNDLIGKNGPKPRFIKLLIYNLAFAGAKVKKIQILSINSEGLIQPQSKDATPQGVRFLIDTQAGRAVTVDYISANISDHGLQKQSHLTRAFQRTANQVVLIKSASHLLQNTYFSTMRNVLLEHAQWITQDETGLDIVPYAERFNLQLYGKFVAPSNLWAKSASAQRLAQYYQEHASQQELPFLLGYEKAGGSMLMIGQRK